MSLSWIMVNAQNIISVDNSPGSTANYTSLQAAIDEAEGDDFIYVTGTGIDYGNITINKKVNIIGPGYFLAANQGGVTNTAPAIVSDIILTAGANNSLISGLTSDEGNPLNDKVHIEGVSNIVFQNNHLYGDLEIVNSSNITVHNNFFDPDYCCNDIIIEEGCSNIQILNNIIYAAGLGVDITSGAEFKHNVILTDNIDFIGFHNTIVKNNIFSILNYPDFANSSSILFNVFTLPQNEIPVNNIGNLNSSSIFIGQGSPDGVFQLKSNSPAIGAGEGGVDCGIFAGASPYVLSGLPSIPIIYSLEAPVSASAGGTIQVKVKARANE